MQLLILTLVLSSVICQFTGGDQQESGNERGQDWLDSPQPQPNQRENQQVPPLQPFDQSETGATEQEFDISDSAPRRTWFGRSQQEPSQQENQEFQHVIEQTQSTIDSSVFQSSPSEQEEDGVAGIQFIIRQKNGMDQLKNLVFDTLFAESDRLLKLLSFILPNDVPIFEKVGFRFKAHDVRVLEIGRATTESIQLTREGIYFQVENISARFLSHGKFGMPSLGVTLLRADYDVTLPSVSFSAIIIPEMKEIPIRDEESGQETLQRRMIVHVRDASLRFNKNAEIVITNNTFGLASFIAYGVKPAAEAFLRERVYGFISTRIINLIKENVPKVSHQMAYAQTASLLKILDTLLTDSYGVGLDLSKNFDYQEGHLSVGTGFLTGRADLYLHNLPDSSLTPNEWKKTFLGPKPKHWNPGTSREPVDLRNDPMYREFRTPGQKIRNGLGRLFGSKARRADRQPSGQDSGFEQAPQQAPMSGPSQGFPPNMNEPDQSQPNANEPPTEYFQDSDGDTFYDAPQDEWL